MATRDDVYISARGIGSLFHVSLHGDPEHWHYGVAGAAADIVVPIPHPKELTPGFRRVLEIRIPGAAVDMPPIAKQDVVWLPKPARDDRWVLFTNLCGAPAGKPSLVAGSAPMGTRLVGRVGVTNGGTACVVVHEEIGTAGAVTFKTDDVTAARAAMLQPNVRGIVIGRVR